MNEPTQDETPHVGIFWVAQTADGEARLLAAGCPPRGRIVFDRARHVFILYADRKLLTPGMIARIQAQFYLPEDRTEIQSDGHYQSNDSPNI